MNESKSILGTIGTVHVDLPTTTLIKIAGAAIAAGIILFLSYSIIKKL